MREEIALGGIESGLEQRASAVGVARGARGAAAGGRARVAARLEVMSIGNFPEREKLATIDAVRPLADADELAEAIAPAIAASARGACG